MSHENVKSIRITKDKVFINSADSSLYPYHFRMWESPRLSAILVEQGRAAALAALGKEIFDGNFLL